MIETGAHRAPLTAEEKRALLARLIEVFQFERFLQKAYLGQKMFSIEGLDAVVPMIDELVDAGAARAAPRRSCSGWRTAGGSPCSPTTSAARSSRSWPSSRAPRRSSRSRRSRRSRTAAPATSSTTTAPRACSPPPTASEIKVRLYPNPSHLEFVDPVVTGRRARRADPSTRARACTTTPSVAVPLLLHGDAAFPGQGVVAETLNLQSLDGYSTGGTVHLITDNQVGFTTDPEEGRSTPYAADMAKGFNVPIIHVNADDVEACIAAIRLAMAYRERWGRDVVIDLIGYRRYGHNETDEPAYTQPMMAAQIKAHPPVSEIYAEQLVKEGVVSAEEVESEGAERARASFRRSTRSCGGRWRRASTRTRRSTAIGTGELDRTKSPEVDTAVSEKRLRTLNEELLQGARELHDPPQAAKAAGAPDRGLEHGGIEFGHAEALAFASLLTEGTPHPPDRPGHRARHLLAPPPRLLHDEKTGCEYVPIQNLPARWRRSSSTTARSRRPPASASSTATRPPRPRAWSSGRRSSATSPTRPR